MESSTDLYKEISGGLDVGGEAGEKIGTNSRGFFGKGEGVVEVAAELVVVRGEEEEEEGVVGACGAVSGSSTASFRAAASADLGSLFWKKFRRSCSFVLLEEVQTRRRRSCSFVLLEEVQKKELEGVVPK
ncbi:hypothetical protein TIFTF001_028433 [Ficus carica]|uniref:Uncharacterized protein n=1 Tax=Ficus carica TaxID=3494 RepID=A0AA88J1R1_FICCA|nr:hypothetical protein TIFTF001_028433 [Ficus carica]